MQNRVMLNMNRFCYIIKAPLLLIIILLSVFISKAYAEDLVLCTPYEPEGVDIFEYVELGFQRIQYNVSFVHVPVERCHFEANAGRYDGICATIEGINENPRYSSLIQVPYVLARAKCMLWATNPEIEINSINDISELDKFTVVYVRGIKAIEAILQERTQHTNYISVSSHDQAFRMLIHKRADVVLDILAFGRLVLSEPEFQNATVYESKKLFGSKTVHLYLHKKHAAIVPLLSNALEELESEGEYERILKISPPD